MFRKKRLIVIICAAIIIAAFFVYTRSLYMVPVLMYHSINTKSDPVMQRLVVSPEAFERQMQFLKSNHYNVVDLETVGRMIQNKEKIPPKTVAITFDDGYKDNYTYAYPVLKKFGLPATIFVIYNEVNHDSRLSWDEIKKMQASGLITIGGHTLGATPLVDIKSEAELRRQIIDSKKILEDKLGTEVNTFCYVGGMFTLHIKDLVKEAGYKYAVATGLGKRFSNDDVYAIKRIRISASSNNLFLFWIKVVGYYNSFRNNSK